MKMTSIDEEIRLLTNQKLTYIMGMDANSNNDKLQNMYAKLNTIKHDIE